MKTTIAANQHYAVEIDQQVNRLYLTGMGFWNRIEIAQNFHEDVKRGIQKLASGYSVLADLSEFKTPPPAVGELIIESQKISAQTIGKSAQVLGKNIGIAMPMNRYASTSGLKGKTRTFAARMEAETWLDAE